MKITTALLFALLSTSTLQAVAENWVNPFVVNQNATMFEIDMDSIKQGHLKNGNRYVSATERTTEPTVKTLSCGSLYQVQIVESLYDCTDKKVLNKSIKSYLPSGQLSVYTDNSKLANNYNENDSTYWTKPPLRSMGDGMIKTACKGQSSTGGSVGSMFGSLFSKSSVK